MRLRKNSLAVLIATGGLLFSGIVAAPQAGAASLVLGSNSYVANTTAMTITGPSLLVHGTDVGGVAVFKFDTITVPAGASITATGSRPFELLSTGAIVVGGAIVSVGTNATDFAAGPNAGGAGGGAGGTNASTKGHGSGGGGVSNNGSNGSGGGGFAGSGARGGNEGTGTTAAGGAPYGNLDVMLQGGSGGGGNGGNGTSPAGGGGGGGAIGLFGSSVTLQSTAVVAVSGGNGASGGDAASGGGSGGGIIVHANSVDLEGELIAPGGAGGAGGCCGDGGGGSGGRIAIQYKTVVSRTTFVSVLNGGASGTESTGGCCSHGTLSLDASGGNGKLTFAQIDASNLSIGASKTVTKGTTVTLATKLTDAGTGAPITGRPVALFKRAAHSGSTWTYVVTKTTSSTGVASTTQKPTASTIYQWRFPGTLIHLKVTSGSQGVTVH